MRANARTGIGAVALLWAVLLQGCGVVFDLDGPSQTSPGAQVNYTLNATNPSVCPVGDVEAFVIPFVRPADLVITGDPDLEELLLAIINALCTGGPFELPDGFVCTIEGNEVTCEQEDFFSTPGGSPVTVSTPDGPLLTCERDGSRVTCQLAHAQLAAALAANGAVQTLTCSQVVDGVECEAARIDPGQTLSDTFGLTAPFAPGVYRTFVIGGAGEQGVCKAGSSSAGAPCDTDAECPGGTGDDCAEGICVNDMTQATGAGCDDGTDCAMGESCVPCQEDGELLLPVACQQIVIGVTAPTMSPFAMAATVLLLFALSALALRRHAR